MYHYLSGKIDLPSFRDWLVQVQVENENNLDDDSKLLVSEIEGRYAEFSDALVSESSWKNRLVDLLRERQPGTESLASISVHVTNAPIISWNPVIPSNVRAIRPLDGELITV